MQAVQVINPGKNSRLEIHQVPTPKPDDHQIRVKIEATALNRADLHQRMGNYPPPEGASDILGLEMAGVVDEIGPEVTRWQPGDRVFGLLAGGGYAEYCITHEEMVLPLPVNLSFEEAAAVPETFLTAFQALHWLGKLRVNETVLVHAGGSGVGTSAIQLASHLYNARIATTAGKERKLRACRELGADFAYNYSETNFADRIREDMGEDSVNLIIDFIGAPYWEKNISVMAPDARLVYLSFLGGHRLEEMSLAPLLKKRLHVMGSTLRSRSVAYKIKLTHDFADRCLELLQNGTMNPVIDSIYEWHEVEKAHERMNNDQNTGKIVLTGM